MQREKPKPLLMPQRPECASRLADNESWGQWPFGIHVGKGACSDARRPSFVWDVLMAFSASKIGYSSEQPLWTVHSHALPSIMDW